MPPPSITWSQQLGADCWVPSQARWQRVKFPSTGRASTPTPWGDRDREQGAGRQEDQDELSEPQMLPRYRFWITKK